MFIIYFVWQVLPAYAYTDGRKRLRWVSVASLAVAYSLKIYGLEGKLREKPWRLFTLVDKHADGSVAGEIAWFLVSG